jgi:hypothetical protein
MEALGDEMEPEQLDSSRREEDQRADAPNFQKLGQSIDTSSQGRWKDELSPEEVRQFERIAGDQSAALDTKRARDSVPLRQLAS